MNIAFFLTPKSEVTWLPEDATMRQAIEEIEHSGYSAVPVLDHGGHYVGTITEGDLLRKMRDTPDLRFADTQDVRLLDVPMRVRIRAVSIDAEMEELFSLAVEQNFVPVVDSRGAFVGIVRRRQILQYCAGELRAKSWPARALD